MTEKIIHLETAIVNMENVAVIKETKTDEETTIEIISSSGEKLQSVNLPKGKKLSDYSVSRFGES